MQRARLETLDSIRGIAAVVVLLHHELILIPAFSDFFWAGYHADLAQIDNPLEALLFLTPLRLLWAGHEAVILFFVLSGFVLALPWSEGRPPHYLPFVIRRFCRIYLPYIAAAALAAALLTIVPHHESDPNSLRHAGNWNNDAVGWRTLVDYLFMLGSPGQQFVNKAMWSLVFEMRVSLVFPLLMLPLLRWRLLGAAGLIVALSAGAAALPASPAWIAQTADTLHYAAYFALGAATAQRIGQIRAALAQCAPTGRMAFLGLGLLLIWRPSYSEAAALTALGAAIVICAALLPGGIERLLMRPALRWLGKISYSLYLMHVPVLLTIYYLARDSVPLAAILVAAFPASLLAAWAFHIAVEAPSMRLGSALTRLQVASAGGHPWRTMTAEEQGAES